MAPRTSATTQEAFCTALALNNIGVALLAGHSYNHALEAFNEAVTIMKRVVSDGAVHFFPAALGASLQKARRNLRTCNSIPSDPPLKFVVLNEQEKEKFIDLVLQEHDREGLPTTPLIRIELQGRSLRELVGKPNVNHESSIILYNYASCCKCLLRSMDLYC